jgi:hypothetical protein
MRLLAKLHARWERVDEMAREKVYTITTNSNIQPLNASKPPPTTSKIENVG